MFTVLHRSYSYCSSRHSLPQLLSTELHIQQPLPQSSPKRFLSKGSTPSLHRILTNRIASSQRYFLQTLSCSSYRRDMPHPRC